MTRFKLSWSHLSRQHLSISAISQLLITCKFPPPHHPQKFNVRNISAVTDPILPKKLTKKKKFHKKKFSPKKIFAKNFFLQEKNFAKKIFLLQKIPKILRQKNFFAKKNFGKKKFCQQIFCPKKFHWKKILTKKKFCQKKFHRKIYSAKNHGSKYNLHITL